MSNESHDGSESLFQQSKIKLYGRVVSDLKVTAKKGDKERALPEGSYGNGADTLARIFGFEFEGTYQDLPTPALFLLEGGGRKVEGTTESGDRLPSGMKVWSCDKNDISVRLDVATGPFGEILVGATRLAHQQLMASGMKVSGMDVSGMNVSGMDLSGMKRRG